MDQNYCAYFDEVIKDKKMEGPPNETDWDNARVFLRFLGKFYTLTKKFSGSYYVTSNFYFKDICAVKRELIKLEECDDPLLNKMAMMMNKKFDKYWGNVEKMNHMMFLGLVLDPRYKLDYLALAFKCIYTDSTSVTLLKGVEDTLRRLYKEYHDRAPPPPLAPRRPPLFLQLNNRNYHSWSNSLSRNLFWL